MLYSHNNTCHVPTRWFFLLHELYAICYHIFRFISLRALDKMIYIIWWFCSTLTKFCRISSTCNCKNCQELELHCKKYTFSIQFVFLLLSPTLAIGPICILNEFWGTNGGKFTNVKNGTFGVPLLTLANFYGKCQTKT